MRRGVAAGFEDGIGARRSNRVDRGGDVGLWDSEPSSAEPDSLRCRRHRSRSRRYSPEPGVQGASAGWGELRRWRWPKKWGTAKRDRKSTRLNSSHTVISYAVFCLKKKKKHHNRAADSDTTQPNTAKPP